MAGLRNDDLEDVAFHPWAGVKDVVSHRFMLPLALVWACPAGTPLYFLLASNRVGIQFRSLNYLVFTTPLDCCVHEGFPVRESDQMKNAIEILLASLSVYGKV